MSPPSAITTTNGNETRRRTIASSMIVEEKEKEDLKQLLDEECDEKYMHEGSITGSFQQLTLMEQVVLLGLKDKQVCKLSI